MIESRIVVRGILPVIVFAFVGVAGCDSNPSMDFVHPDVDISRTYVGKLHGEATCQGRVDATRDELKSWYDERMKEHKQITPWEPDAVTGIQREWRVSPEATVTVSIFDLGEHRSVAVNYFPD